ncbi:MAG: hypothetical protein QW568_01835 [Candidatus Anstonellaceae archaeon]
MPWKSTCRAIFGRERYLQVKQAVINGIAAKLEQEKDFSRGIYNFG